VEEVEKQPLVGALDAIGRNGLKHGPPRPLSHTQAIAKTAESKQPPDASTQFAARDINRLSLFRPGPMVQSWNGSGARETPDTLAAVPTFPGRWLGSPPTTGTRSRILVVIWKYVNSSLNALWPAQQVGPPYRCLNKLARTTAQRPINSLWP
jgi:hypothetical protein